MEHAKPLYIFDMQEWHREENGFRELPPYIVAIFPDNTDISRIRFSKKARKTFKGNRELQIAKYNQFQDIIEVNKQGENHCKIGNSLYKWSSTSCNFDYGDTNNDLDPEWMQKVKSCRGIIVKLKRDSDVIHISNSKSIYVLNITRIDTKYMKHTKETFIAIICQPDIDLFLLPRKTKAYANDFKFKIVSGKVWNKIISLYKKNKYQLKDGFDYYTWQRITDEERGCIRLVIKGKDADNIRKAHAFESSKKQRAKNEEQIKAVFNLEMILYVYVHYPSEYLHDYKMETVRAGVLCIDGEIRYISAYYCQERNFCLVSYYDYQLFQSRYGFILTKIYRVKNDSLYAMLLGEGAGFREQSELNLHGYNVGKKDNLSEQERHEILAGLLDYGIMNKYSIELYLQQFITLNGAK